MIYLDNAATTRISQEVLEAMTPYLCDSFGNPGAIYKLGREAAEAVSGARKKVARFFGCLPRYVVFTSGGSEGNSLVIKGLIPHLKSLGKTTIVTSKTEHDSVIKAVCEAEERHGFTVKYVDIDSNGQVKIDALEALLEPSVGLVSIMYVNNETGVANDVQKISELCKRNGVLFHSDCVQAAGFYPIEVSQLGCDFVTISGHKINAPKGVGAVFAKRTELLSPIISGGSSQEWGVRGGTENVAGIVGLGKACEMVSLDTESRRRQAVNSRNTFVKVLQSELSKVGLCDRLFVAGSTEENKIANFRIDGVYAMTLILALDGADIYMSAGSACRAQSAKPSKTLLAMGFSEREAMSSVRASFSHSTTDGEAIEAAKAVAETAKSLLEVCNVKTKSRKNS